jgi:ribonuclease HII
VEKVIVPLIKKQRNGGEPDADSNTSVTAVAEVVNKVTHAIEMQELRNQEYERRLADIESTVKQASEINTAIQTDLREALTTMKWIKNDWRRRRGEE